MHLLTVERSRMCHTVRKRDRFLFGHNRHCKLSCIENPINKRSKQLMYGGFFRINTRYIEPVRLRCNKRFAVFRITCRRICSRSKCLFAHICENTCCACYDLGSKALGIYKRIVQRLYFIISGREFELLKFFCPGIDNAFFEG